MIFYSDINRQDNLIDGKVYDLEAVYQSIDSILKTQKGERLFMPEFGTDLEQYLFDLSNPETELFIYDEIIGAVEKYEPRVIIDHQKSGVFLDPLNHVANIELVFSIRGKRYDEYIYQSALTNSQKERYYEL